MALAYVLGAVGLVVIVAGIVATGGQRAMVGRCSASSVAPSART